MRLVLDEYNSGFITYELKPGICTFKGISEALFNILQPKYKASRNVSVTEFEDITMKTKLVVRDGIMAIGFDENWLFSTILSFNYGWVYKSCNEYNSQKNSNLITTLKRHSKCDCINGSNINGVRQPIMYSFVLEKLPGYKVVSEPETIHYEKIKVSVLNTITFRTITFTITII